jgi:hypothetical protein
MPEQKEIHKEVLRLKADVLYTFAMMFAERERSATLQKSIQDAKDYIDKSLS